MKIGIVSPYDMYRFGGVQEHIKDQATELKKRGFDVKILAPQPARLPVKVDPNIILLGQSTRVKALKTTTEIAISLSDRQIDEIYSMENFDVMHFHEPWVPILSRQLLSRSPVPNLATFHAKLPDTIINKSFEKAIIPYTKSILKYLDHLTAVSEPAASYVRKITRRHVQIIPNGINLDKFDPLKVNKYKDFNDSLSTIVYIGRLEKRKGVGYLLRAYRSLVKTYPEVRLLIAGDGPKRKTLQNYVSNYKLPNVYFLGFVSDEEKLQLLKRADVFTSPALYGESFGIVLLEAMSMGAPIVAGDNPGYSSVLSGRGRLSLVNPKNIKDYALKMELLLSDPKLAKLLSEWGLNEVKKYDFPLIVDKYESIYKKLINDNAKTA